MTLEVATLDVIPGQEADFERAFSAAQEIIASMPGYISHRLERCVERENRYVLLVDWRTLADHTEGFRGSSQYQEWKRLLHHFYDPFPTVEHYEDARPATVVDSGSHLDVIDQRVFVPALNFTVSRDFYRALGWRENWCDGRLAELELGGVRLLLQDYYLKAWAENFMLQITVADADAWHAHAAAVLASGSYGSARVTPPKLESWGFLVTYVHDPSGVLLHFAQKA